MALSPPGCPSRTLTRSLAASLRANGILSFGFLDRKALVRACEGLAADRVSAYGLDAAGGAAVAALPYDTTGKPAGDPDAAFFRDPEGRPLGALGWFARNHWYKELAGLLASAARALSAQEPGLRSGFRTAVNSRLPEKALAAAAGLGPVGRNTLVLDRLLGPGCVLGVLILPFEPEPDEAAGASGALSERPGSDCGDCVECVRACPTGALRPEGGITRELCIQHWASTEAPVPENVAERWAGNLYGCDLCLAACPRFRPGVARRAGPGFLERGVPLEFLLSASDEEIRRRLRGTALGLGWMRPPLLRRNALLAASSRAAAENRASSEPGARGFAAEAGRLVLESGAPFLNLAARRYLKILAEFD